MKRFALVLTLAALAFAQPQARTPLNGQKPHVSLAKGKKATHKHPGSKHRGGDGNGILYHGGPVMLDAPVAHVIWYGNWTAASPAVAIVTDLLSTIGGSPYESVNATYHDGTGAFVTGQVTLGLSVFDNYSRGKTLGDSDVQAIVAAHIGKDLPLSANAIYFVLTSGDVAETSGFGSQYCGWHSSAIINGSSIKYAFVGDPTPLYVSGCSAEALGPNGSSGGDGMASVIAHEMEETISDPEQTAWYFRTGNENADQCAWMFGTLYNAANGAKANMKLGTRDFLIQQNWLNAGGGSCVLAKP